MDVILDKLPTDCLANMAFGAVGAILVVIYRVYTAIPEIEVLLQGKRELPFRFGFRHMTFVGLKILLSVASASLFTALVIKPQDITGALTAGMSWTALIREYIKK